MPTKKTQKPSSDPKIPPASLGPDVSLRSRYAMAALTGILSRPLVIGANGKPVQSPDCVVKEAWDYADRMMKEIRYEI